MMKKYLFLFLFSFFAHNMMSQVITGRLVDENRQPISFVNVRLEQTDSVFVSGTTSGNDGEFSLLAPANDGYLLILSCVGYVTNYIKINNLTKKVDVGNITLYDSSQTIDEVTVSASRVVAKLDKQVLLPSEIQIRTSSSGYDLLNKLILPGIRVNTIQRTVTTNGGGTVELRINDIKATTAQVQALRPTSIIRIEYIDNPGIRYADSGVEAVINYVIKRQESGFEGGVGLMNAFTTGFGNDNIYLKANHKQSEFGLNYYVSYRDYDDRYANEKQTFEIPENIKRYRALDGVAVPFGYADHQIELSYNLTNPDSYIFNVVFRENIFHSPHQDFSQIISEESRPDLQSLIKGRNKSESPSLDLYYQLTLPHKQTLSANVVGTYIGTEYNRDYAEYLIGIETPQSSYGYETSGKRYSLIGEAIYKKEFEKTVLSVGFQGMQAYTHNKYMGTPDVTTRMHNSNYYGFLQLQGKIKKVNYMIGAGLSRQYFDGSEQGYTYYTFRPSLILSYPLFEGALLRYNFSITPYLPSLAALSDISRQKTDIEIECGNRNLKPYRSYQNRLVFSWGNKYITTQLNGSYSYSRSPIMEEISRIDTPDEYIFIYGLDNQSRYSRLNSQLYVRANVIRDMLTLMGYVGVNRYDSRGHVYSHKYTSWYGGGKLLFNYKKFSMSGEIGSRYNSLFGESIEYGENNSSIECSYNLKNVQIGLGVLYPFTSKGWSAGERKLSKLVQKESWTYIGNNANMLVLTLNWNFNSGRKSVAGEKSLYNSDTDSGIAK